MVQCHLCIYDQYILTFTYPDKSYHGFTCEKGSWTSVALMRTPTALSTMSIQCMTMNNVCLPLVFNCCRTHPDFGCSWRSKTWLLRRAPSTGLHARVSKAMGLAKHFLHRFKTLAEYGNTISVGEINQRDFYTLQVGSRSFDTTWSLAYGR